MTESDETAPETSDGARTMPPRRADAPFIGPFSARQVGLILATVVGSALILLTVTLPLGPSRSPAPSLPPGASFFRIGAETQGLQIGQRAPDFVGTNEGKQVRLTDLDGKEVRLSDYAEKPLWVVFWATWCPPCQQETPDLRATYEAHRTDGLVLLAIDIQEPAETPRNYAATYGLSYPIGVDTTAAIMRTYGVFGLPTHYFIDTKWRHPRPLFRSTQQEADGRPCSRY